jgi:hypothetical protein
MLSLIGDRFLKRFLKGFRSPSKGGSASGAGTLAESAANRMDQSDDLEKLEMPEKAVELTHKFHHPQGDVNGTPAATQQPGDPQKQNQPK